MANSKPASSKDKARAQAQAQAGKASAAPAPGQQPAGPAQAGVAPGPPAWFGWATFVLALIGLGISAYETVAHFTGNKLAGCPRGTGTFNCTAVITSPQSMIFGVIPVAVLGLAFYVFAAGAMSPWAWRWRRPEAGLIRLGSLIAGVGFVLYLVYAEVFQIRQVCEYCTGVHVVTFLLFCFTVIAAALWGLGERRGAGR